MILADTSVWFDHLRRRDPRLRAALEAHQICIHPMVVGELACSNLRSRAILAHLHLLPPTTLATHDEALAMIEQHKLMARGVEFVDAHLLASAKLSNASLWTRDVRLAAIAAEFGIGAAANGLHRPLRNLNQLYAETKTSLGLKSDFAYSQ